MSLDGASPVHAAYTAAGPAPLQRGLLIVAAPMPRRYTSMSGAGLVLAP
jgi:hypothetical protein